jgi:hypothetical protein
MMNYNKTFYVKRNGNVIACKFKKLYFWFNSTFHTKTDKWDHASVSYTLLLADGKEESGYCSGSFGNIAETIENCLNEVWIEKFINLTDEVCEKALGFVPDKVLTNAICGPKYYTYYAWVWDGYKAVYVPLGSKDGGACRSTAWYDALTQKFEMRKHYKTEKECVDDNKIKVITFEGEQELEPQKQNYSVRVFASRIFEVQAASYEDAEIMAKQMLSEEPLNEGDIDDWQEF